MDIEVFIVILLIQRHIWGTIEKGARTAEEMAFLSMLGDRKPTVQQEKFWRTMLVNYGKVRPNGRVANELHYILTLSL